MVVKERKTAEIKDIPIQFPPINIDFLWITWSSFCLCKRINWIIFIILDVCTCLQYFNFFTFLLAIIFQFLLIVKINWSRFFAYVLQQKTIFLILFMLLTSTCSSMRYYFGRISVESFFTIMTMSSCGSMTTSNTNTTWYTSW